MQINSNMEKTTSSHNNYTMNHGGVNQDDQIKLLQKQIENVQKQLQSLSDNKEMSPEEKMEKRKILQQKIQDLNKQISQRKMEIQQEKQAAAEKVEKQEVHQKSTAKEDYNTIGTAAMEGIISSDISMKQISVIQSTKTNIEGRSSVLKKEIEMDKSRGVFTEKKEAELLELDGRINTTTTGIIDKISDINAELDESREVKHGQDGIRSKKAEENQDDIANADTQKNKVDYLDMLEQKSESRDKPVVYTKAGESVLLEAEVKLSVLV